MKGTSLLVLCALFLCLASGYDLNSISVTHKAREPPSSIESNGLELFPLVGFVIPSAEWKPECEYDLMITFYSRNETEPVIKVYSAPFANVNVLVDGVVAVDPTEKIIYTWLETDRRKGSPGHNGGTLVGLLAEVQHYEGQHYLYGGVNSAPLISNAAPYKIAFYNKLIWAWITRNESDPGCLVSMDPASGIMTLILNLPDDQGVAEPFNGVIDNNGIFHMMVYAATPFGFIYSIDLNTLEVIAKLPVQTTDIIANCSEWNYDPNNDTVYALCYVYEVGNYLARLNVQSLEVQLLGSEPLVPYQQSFLSGTFTIDPTKQSAYVIVLYDSGTSLLAKVNLTGDGVAFYNIRNTGALFLTYVPWL